MHDSEQTRSVGHLAKKLASRAMPVWFAQISVMFTAVVDTLVAAHASTAVLAAVGIGASIYVCFMLTFNAVTQGVMPVAAQYWGAKRRDMMATVFQHGVWLALCLGLGGCLVLSFPGWMLRWAETQVPIQAMTEQYLKGMALCLPMALLFRACSAVLNGMGQPRALGYIGPLAALLHLMLSPTLSLGWFGLPALGVMGMVWAQIAAQTLSMMLAWTVLVHMPAMRELGLTRRWTRPRWPMLREILAVGAPSAVSSFIELTGFQLVALWLAPLGAVTVAVNRILTNIFSICFMLPMSLGVATTGMVGHAVGSRSPQELLRTIRTALVISVALMAMLGLLLYGLSAQIAAIYTTDEQVRASVSALMLLLALNQLGTAVSTINTSALRGLKRVAVLVPINIVCSWGLRAGLGALLCFHGVAGSGGLGLVGFLYAGIAAGALYATLTGVLLWRACRPRTLHAAMQAAPALALVS